MDLQEFRTRLRLNKHTLDDELEVHAELQEQISERVARLNSTTIQAKESLARLEGSLLLDLKDRTTKITKDEAEATILRDPKRREAWSTYQQAREELERWQGLYDAWKQKGKDMEALGRLYASQYFAVSSVSAYREARAPLARRDYTEEAQRPARRRAE